MIPRAGNTLTHGGHRAAALPFQHGTQAHVPLSPKSIHAEHCANTYFLCAGKAERGAQGGTSTQQEAQLDGSDTCGTASTSTITVGGSTHPYTKTKTKKKTKEKKQRRQGVAVCVWRCGCLPALAAKKTKQEGRNVCSAPQALVARPQVTAPSARRSSRPLLMRAAGEAHRAVVMSVSVGMRVEQLGGNTRHPSQEECSNKQLKREEWKRKTVHSDCPKSKKRREGSKKLKQQNRNIKKRKHEKSAKKV
ncbi:hypothetical protein TCSYLVIO_006619 [Trypanosoma cruzi]|nr:hypothetical protein TCSYLVIO_006619 [Trypanosoma cruzi]